MSGQIKHPVRTKNRLSTAIDDLLADIESGDKFMKVYKQMKMYNDDELNPVLYQGKKMTSTNLSNKIKHIMLMIATVLPLCKSIPEVKITVISRLFSNLFEGIAMFFFAFDEKQRHKGL
jgi:hypothetical protein